MLIVPFRAILGVCGGVGMNAMKTFQSTPYDISDWITDFNQSSYGKREKGVCYSLVGKEYYFKYSDPRYPWEFWSEVIASKLGQGDARFSLHHSLIS